MSLYNILLYNLSLTKRKLTVCLYVPGVTPVGTVRIALVRSEVDLVWIVCMIPGLL